MENINLGVTNTVTDTDNNPAAEDVKVNQNGDEQNAAAPEKVFTQDEVNEIVKERTSRFSKKNNDLKEKIADLEARSKDGEFYKQLLLKAGITDVEAQSETLEDTLGLEVGTVKKLKASNTNEVSKADAWVDAQEFLKSADDEDVIEKVDDLVIKQRKSGLTNAEAVMLRQCRERYIDIKIKNDISEALKFCNSNNIDYDSVTKSEEFNEFMSDTNLTLTAGLKKFAKLKGNDLKKKPQNNNTKPTTGSAKDTGGTEIREFYSKEEVEKMSPSEVRKNLAVIQKSMVKW